MSAQIEMEPTTEALMLLEAEHRDTVEAWGRIRADAVLGATVRRYFGQKLTEAELQRFIDHMKATTPPPDRANDFALMDGAVGVNTQRNRWNG